MKVLLIDDDDIVIKSYDSHDPHEGVYVTSTTGESFMLGGYNPVTLKIMATSALTELHDALIEWTDKYSSNYKEPVNRCSLKQFIYTIMNDLALTKPIDLTPDDIELIKKGNISEYYMIHQDIKIDDKPIKIHGVDIEKYLDQKGR